MRSLHYGKLLPALASLVFLGCSSGGGGGGGQTVTGNWYGCEADIMVGGLRYQLPTSCLAVSDPTRSEPKAPTGAAGPTLQLQGICACALSAADASAICSAASSCDQQLSDFFKERAAALNKTMTLGPSDLHCYPRGGSTPGGTITALISSKTCNVSGEDVSTIQLGLTAANGDYEAALSGVNVDLTVHKTIALPDICDPILGLCIPTPDLHYNQTRTFVASGDMRYSLAEDGAGACPAGGCPLRVDSLVLLTPGQSAVFDPPIVASHTVSNVELRALGTLAGKLQNDGSLTLSGRAIIRFDVDGVPHTVTTNVSLTGTLDRSTGAVSIDGFSNSEGSPGDDSGQKVVSFGQINGTPFNHPPVAVITAPSTVECVTPTNTPLVVSANQSTDLENDIVRYQWLLPDQSSPLGASTTATLTLGPNPISVLVSDARLGTGAASKTVAVVDTTPPALVAPTQSNYTLCDSGTEPVILTAPIATDGCTGVARVFGQATPANGGPPVTFEAGQSVALGLGNQVIHWFATDVAGNTSHLDQTINVAPVFTAFNSFQVRDRAHVVVASGTPRPATIGNAGSVITELGANSTSGTVLSTSDVFLRSNTTITGNVTSLGHIQLQTGARVLGLQQQVTNPQLPSSMPLFAPRPIQHNGALTLDPGAVRTLTPGSYGSVIVHPNAIVQLSSGSYTFDDLLLDTGAVWRVPAGATIQIVIRNDLTHRGNFVITGNNVQPTQVAVLAYGNQVILGPSANPTAFYGWSLFAPNATTAVSNNATLAQLMSRIIEVAADRTLSCVRSL